VIPVHRIKGEPMFVNADLIESIEATPETVLTLVDGRCAVVRETPEEIVALIRAYRASIIVEAEAQRSAPPAAEGPYLRVVHGDE
jgi:flagellar protein FlbD